MKHVPIAKEFPSEAYTAMKPKLIQKKTGLITFSIVQQANDPMKKLDHFPRNNPGIFGGHE